jgi:antitoxin HicB
MRLSKKYKEWVPCYSYRIHWSDEDKVYVVSVDELPGCMTHGDSMQDAIKMGLDAVEGHIGALLSMKQEIPEPISKIKVSGEFIVRSNPAFHKKLIEKAHQAGFKTLNKYVLAKLSEV